MFPRFDNLIDSQSGHIVDALRNASVPVSAEASQSLIRIAGLYRKTTTPAGSKSVFAEPLWYQILSRILQEVPTPDAVLSGVEQYLMRAKSLSAAFSLFEETPRSLEVLARICCNSPFLTQILISEAGSLESLARQRRTAEMKSREDFKSSALAAIKRASTQQRRLELLLAFQRTEVLRIGMCDAFGLFDLKFVTLQISLLADAIVQVCLQMAGKGDCSNNPQFAVVALGKLGGEELNYSSDIDLVLIADDVNEHAHRTARRLIDLLSRNTAAGFLYRVDMRLRPWGDAGPLVTTVDSYHRYLEHDAELWEKQALLKARIIAGAEQAGRSFLKNLPGILVSKSTAEVQTSILRIKHSMEERLKKSGRLTTEVKVGIGSIRDIEFLVQALQLLHGQKESRVYSANTLDALMRLAELGILNAFEYRQLREGYIFLRALEHGLQLRHNLQTHHLPDDEAQQELLALRLDFSSRHDFMERFHEHRHAVRRTFLQFFPAAEESTSTVEPDDRRDHKKVSSSLPVDGPVEPQHGRLTSDILDIAGRNFLKNRSKECLNLLQDRTLLSTSVAQDELASVLNTMLTPVLNTASSQALFHHDAVRLLNQFKDRQLFRIDLRHVLGMCQPFGQFSKEITELADVVVTKALQVGWADLVRNHGQPRLPGGEPCRFCAAALGKFGGKEMGVASDLEFFVVYEEEGQTDSENAVTNGQFFEKLVGQLMEIIAARHKGIFEVDLRFRPHGQAGSPAVALKSFRDYFGPDGECWPFERQGMVKLRPVGGAAGFHKQVVQCRNEIVYDGRPFDFHAMRASRERQIRQLVRADSINVKLSSGGLVDCEYAVQALQISYGKLMPELRSANTLVAMNAAKDNGLISAEQLRSTKSAYQFLREIIDCLRMARGNATDLTLPTKDLSDVSQLGRRMKRIHGSEFSLDETERQMQTIRDFAEFICERCANHTEPSA